MGSSKRTKTRKQTGQAAKPRPAPRRHNEYVPDLTSLSSDCYWEQDEHYRFTRVTCGASGNAKFDEQDFLGTTRWDHGGLPVGDAGSWENHQATLTARKPFTDFLFKRPDPGGALRYLSTSGQPVFDDQGQFRGYRGIDKDVTERIQMELRLSIEHGVTRVLAESSSIAEAAPQIIRVICETLGWSCGARWVPDEGGDAIRCAETWGVAAAEIDAFLESTRRQAPSTQLGGLNRRAWIQGEPLWIQDVTKDETFRRGADALNAGLHSAMAFPIKVGTKSIGVLDFFSREILQPNAQLLNATRYIGSQIGQFMQRKEAEEGLRESEERFRAVVDSANEGILVYDRALHVISGNAVAERIIGLPLADIVGAAGFTSLLPCVRADGAPLRPEDRPTRITIRTGSPLTGQILGIKRSDGSVTWLSVNTGFLRRPGESDYYGVVSTFGDVTAQRQAEAALRDSEARFRSLTSLSSDWFWGQDAEFRFTRLEGRHVTGDNSAFKSELGKTLWEIGVEVEGKGGWEAHRALIETHEPFRDVVLWRTFQDGQRHYMSVSGEPIFDTEDRFVGYRGVGKDITESRRGEQLLILEHTVTRYLADADNVPAVLKAAIRAVCETEGWECGRYFRVDEKAGVLRFAEAWSVSGELMDRFIEKSRELSYVSGVGLIGQVWQSGRPIWSVDIAKDPRVHVRVARDAGLHGAFVFPVLSEGKTIGVLIFHSSEVREPEERLLQTIDVIGNQIGQFVQRKQAEEVLRDSEERFRSLTSLSSDWFWEQDTEFRFTRLEGRHITGDSSAFEGELGKTLEEIGVEVEGGSDAHRARLEAHQPFRNVVMWRTSQDGQWHYMSVSGEPRFDNEGRFLGYRGVGEDITARKREQQLLALEHAVNRSLTDAEGVHEPLKLAICHICETEGWDCGRYLRVDEKAGVLRFGEAWSVPSAQIERYIEDSRGMVYGPGVGLVGRVWQSGQPLWVADIGDDARVARTTLARETGMHGAFAVAVLSEGKTIGVLIFHSREIREPDARLLQAMRVIGSQIGQFIQRRQAEDTMRESEARFRSLSSLSSDWFWEQDAAFRFTRMQGRHITGDSSAFASELGKTRMELGVEVEGGWEAHHARLETHEPFRDVVMWRTSPDGQLYYMSVSGEPRFDDGGRFIGYRGVGEDITAHKREEQLLALEHAVNRCLSEADGVSEALKSVIRTVCESQSWECGRYFYADNKAGLLRFGEAWGIPDAAIEGYIAASRDYTSPLDKGSKARVWQTGEPRWSQEISQHGHLVQSTLDSARDSFVFAVTAEGTALGVLSFTSREVREPDARLLQAVRVIGSQIGQFLQRKLAEEVLRDSEARFRSLTSLSSDWFWEQDAEFRFTRFEGRPGVEDGKKIAGMDLIGKPHWETGAEIEDEAGWDAHRALLQAHQPYRDVVVMSPVLAHGNRRYFSLGGEPVFDSANCFTGYRGVAREITERKRAEERIQYLATHDGLTALPNRSMFSQFLGLAINSAQRYQRQFAVLFLDLDRFKLINDTLGHDAGDTLLQEVSRRVKESLRSSDVVARLGGDEFVVLLQDLGDHEQIVTVARKLLSAVIQPVDVQGQECRVTASIGISVYPTDAQDEQTLMKNADMAMYLAKEQGKNNFQFYSKDIKTQSLERLTLENSLRRALEREEFFLHYQAKLDLTTGAITGVETLLRWQHPDLGLVAPMQFIPLAEETGLIVPIGEWVLRTACAQNVAWQRAGLPPVCMAVNLSPRQFLDDNLLRDLAAALEETGLAPELLELEITESMVMGNIEQAAKLLRAIKQMGVRLAIDDFGTGYSSLAQIKRFPIDTIKVDSSFIRDIPLNAEDRAITEAIIAMGRSLSLTVVAEGVETQEQQTFLREHACDEMQGFYFSKPVAPEQFAELLRTHVATPSSQKKELGSGGMAL